MGKPFWRSVEYFFTGNYSADDGNNSINAIGLGGEIYAYGGDDHINLGSIGATVYTGEGNDTVSAGAGYLRVDDTGGNLTVRGAAGYADINKSGDGNVSFEGAAGGVDIEHTGRHGRVDYAGAAAYNRLVRKGDSGGMSFSGAGGYNSLWHETNDGDLSFSGAGAGNKIDRTWFDKYQGSHGNVSFYGAGAANSISSRVETGNIFFAGVGADNHLVRRGKVGDITMKGAGASNRIERTRNADDVYTETRGDIVFEGAGGYNSLYSDVAHGNIHFSGAGAYNEITRKGTGNHFKAQGIEYAKAGEVILTKATMHGISIGHDKEFHPVQAVKSQLEPNTYLFAIADSTYTKINKIHLYNDSETGKLKYYSEAWFKRGNHLENLTDLDVSYAGGFESNPVNGGYTLSDLKVEHQKPVTIHAVEENLTENQWVTYGGGTLVDAADVTLADAKMSGYAVYADGTAVDVSAVKSNRKPNTYIYAKKLGAHTKMVVVELANDKETGELKYLAKAWYKTGDHTADLANAEISIANGFHEMGTGGYSLSDLNYSVNAFRTVSENVADIDEYSDKELIPTATDVGDSSGDVRFEGAGGGNVINSNVTRGNVYFHGGGIANVIQHSSKFGDTEFIGGGAANVIVKSGEQGDLTFRGAGLANVLVHQGQQGKMDVNAGGAANVLVRVGDGEYLAHLLAIGNISVHKGNGDSQVTMLGGFNTHTQAGNGNATWMAAGGFNVMAQSGKGEVVSVLAGGANVLSKIGDGNVIAGMLGGANVITHIHSDTEASGTTAVALGGANILTKKGKGDVLAVMGGGANVLTHVGDGATTGVMVGGANVLTKVGNGDTTGVMLGIGNVLTHVGDGQTLGVMGAVGNIFTKVGDGTAIAAMAGAGNIFTHVGEGDAWALMGGMGNVFTKVGNGNALALMVAEANVFTHIGDGMSVALMLAKGNIATKVGNGTALAAMVGNANIFTHIGNGDTFAAMIGQANIMTKVGNDLTAALMVGKANIMTHVGDGTSLGMFAGEANIMTKVGDGTTLAAMFGKANIMTHVGDGLTGVLVLGEANIVTKVGDDFMGVVAAAKANVVTHVGDATTAAVLAGKGNILTKVGEGTTVGLLLSEVGNVMTHVGDGATIGFAKGKANIITKVGDGLGINAGWGNANVFTHVGDGDRYNFAKGEANVITKVGDGQEVSVVQGKANIVTHVGNGDDYTGAWGEANVITKVGDGRNVVLAKGEANIVTQVGSGDSFNALWSKGNIVTKVGDGMQVTAAKGQANITTTVGNGLSVTAAYGDANINTKVGDGLSVNVAWGKFNVNTKVGDGLNVAVMKGKANANIHVGDGLGINASYAQNNVAIKIGNGDFYSLAVAASNTSSNKLSALFDNIKQTVLGVGGSQAINYLVQGDDASASGSRKGKGAIDLAEVSSIDGFQMDEIDEVSTDLGDSLSSSVTAVETPDLDQMQSALSVKDAQGVTSGAGKDTTSAVESEALSDADSPNLITNGDFSLGGQGWQSTNGIEADFWASAYGIETNGQDSRVSELATAQNTTIYQDLQDLVEGSVISLNFDFAKRQGISADNGIEVIWNGDVVFSSSGDESVWQQKSLELTAQAGTNRIEFKGTGENDGLGYVLDNVVAKVEKLPQDFAVTDTDSDKPNLIINGDFEQGGQGWQSTNGIEADYKASVYGIDDDGHGSRVTELATATNTSIFQDLQDLADGEVISLSFDFAKREGISADKGIEVIWNGDVVFSTSGDESVWQQKTMQLAAKAGSNRIEFKGTGQNNGLGYILDNVVAKSEGVPQSNHISEYAKQDETAKNAMADKARAEADRERLEQEKEKQLAALSGSQSQLESTDQQALENNGQVQRDEVKSEADEVTAELTAMAQGLDALEGHADYNGESGNSWREHFAGGILDGVQGELDSAKDVSDEYLSKVLTAIADNQKDVKEAVAKSEAGAAKGEQHRAGAEQDIADAKADAAARKAEALSQQEGAEQAERDAHSALQDAQSRGERDTMAAENKASQAQADAKGAKLDDDYRPDREGAAGSGLSGDGFDVQGASETAGHVDAEATAGAEALAEADGRYSEDLAEEGLTEEEQEALEAAKEAVNQLQINAGVRSRDSGATISSMFTQAHADSIVASVASGSDALGRKGPEISGVNLEGLGEATKTSDSSVIDRAYQVADIYRWLEFGDRRANTGSLNVPGVDPYQVDIYKSEFVSMVNHVAGYIDANNSSIPRDNLVQLASLFVQSTIQYDWNGRLRFLQALEQFGYSFEPAHGKKTVAAFRSSGSRSEYRDVFSTEGNQVVFERDIPGIAFANELNKQLLDWGGTHLNMREQGDAQLMDSIFAATDSNAGFWKSVHAAGTQGDAYVVTDGGLRVDNAFWNTELPVLRELQHEGLVGEIRLLDKPASEYQGVSPEKIGHRLTDADVTVTARFDSLGTEQQQRLMTDNPGGYQPDSVVELNVKANAIDDMLRQSIPFYGLRADRNLLLQEGESSFEVRDPSGNSDDVKHIIVNPEDLAQIKSMERFILANFDSYDQLPEELYLVDGKVLSQQDGRTRLLAQKLDGVWQYKPKTELMSEAELLEAAFVKGKLRGESYQKVIDALADYHSVLKEYADNELEAVEKLTNLHKQIEGYLLGHPDSQRAQGLKILLDQVNVRIEEVSVLAESEKVVSAQESFSRLYDQLDNANLKSGKHLYIDNEGNFATKGKGNIAKFNKLSNGQDAVNSVKAAVAKEYGQEIADDVFTQLSAKELAKDGKGIDISGLKNIHRAIEQAVSPFSATLYVWKPSDHSYLGHTALQIGQGRVHVKAEDAPAFNQNNYVSWWPLDSKSLNPKRIQGVVASPHETLTSDMESEEGDGFGLESADIKLKRFIEKMNAAKGDYTKFKDVTEAYTMTALMNPEMLESAGIDPSVYQPFVDQWNDTGNDMTEVAKRFAEALRNKAQQSGNSEAIQRRINNVVRQFAERELEKIEKFRAEEADKGRVFRINLEGLDVASMQAEWQRIRNQPDARYQLLTKNCSSTVAKVLKAGGADKLIGHTWRPKFGVWTPTELYNFGQALQEAQLEIVAKKQKRQRAAEHEPQLGSDNSVEKTAVSEADAVSSHDSNRENYQSRDLVLEPIKQPESIELGMPEVDQKALSDIAERENIIIGVRPVDEKSKSLIASKMYSSKGLFVKAKSSDWGPMSGFIPVDQSFAKASARRDLAKFNGYAEQSIQSGNAVGADLYLNQIRVDELVSKYHSLTPLELDAESGMYKTTATNGDQTVPFFLNKVTVDGKELWQVHYMKDGELAPFKVIGDPVSKQPMTADYDLLTVMHPYGDLGPQDKVKQPLTWEQWKESVTYEDLTPKYKELYDNEALYNKKDGASLGIVSDRLKELKDVINTGLGRTNGLEMVHHGADDANPYAVMADNFPATFFVPKSFFAEDGLGEGKGSIQTYFNVNEQGAVVIRNPQEFSNFQQVAINASYRASLNDKWNAGLDKPLFTKEEKLSHAFLDARDELAKKLNGEVLVSEKDAKLTGLGERQFVGPVQNRNVENWESVAVTPQADGGETRFDGQIIIQAENDPVAAKAAARLAGKHPDSSVVVQLDADGKYHVVYGDPSQLSGKLRWQVVGHGRDESETNNTRLSGYSADELAEKLVKFNQDFSQAENITAKPDHISIVGCSLVSDDKQKGFGNRFITAMDANGIRSDVSARSSDVAVDSTGRKHTRDANEQWAHKVAANKVVLSWNEQGEVVTHIEAIRNGIAEGDVDLARVGQSDSEAPARGAIGDNGDVFTAPEKRKNSIDTASSNGSDRHLSYSGNIQVNVGDGEFTAVNWGTSNVGIKVGTGGFKSLAFGDNNVMVHVGNGDSKHSFDMAGYQALEGAQMFIGNRNVSFNMGRSNDLIVMMDKSIPTPPLVNPFDGASRISGVLQGIARSGEGQDWLAAQEKQWTLSGAKKFVKDMSGLDQSSSVDYTSLVELDSHNERSSRGLKHDAEATLNKQYNKWLSGNSNSDTSKMSRADKFRQANEKLAFNFAVGGQGADIQVTTGNWNFMFGDNIQSILDTNLGSLFGLMTQQFSATGQAKTTFTYNPQDLPRQLKNKLLGKLAGVGAETTLGDIFGVDYTAGGHIVSRNGESVDGVAILKEMLEVIGEFSGDQLQAFTDPAKLLDSLKSGIDMGADGIKSFAESHGLKEKAPDEEEDKSSVSVNGSNAGVEQAAGEKFASADSTKQERAFGFNALNLPNLFATIFSQDKQTEMKSLVENLKDNLTADLLNMKEQTFDFLRNSGHLQGDGDINVSLGNYNFNWGGDGKDLGAYLGDNNNFWGGRGDDVYYATGTSNIFTGGEGNDMGVLMGRENMMFGGDGNDTAVVAGRINHVFMGAGDDQSFVFGEGGEINTGTGRDYVVTSGNFNRVDTGEDQDYSVTIGNNNQVELGGGNDFANVFGNYNRVNGSAGNDVIKLMGYHAVLNGGEGGDHLIAAAISKFSQFDGGQGRDLMVLGGYQNTFKGGEDVDSFIVSGNVIDNLVEDIRSEDNIVFNGVDWQNLWFERSGYDLKLSVLREPEAETDQAKFESVGSVTFADYFNGNRADLVIGMGEKDAAGEREYTALSDNAVDALVQAMSSFAPQAGDNGFIDNLDSKARVAVTTAWSDVTNGKGAIA